MTFQEMMNKVNLKQELKNSYDLIKLIQPDPIEEEWMNVIEAKLRLQLETLNNWTCLYSEGYCIAKFKALLDAHLPYLIGNLKSLTFFAENGLILGDTITSESTSNSKSNNKSNTTSSVNADMGYSGFGVNNQEGRFSGTDSSARNDTTNDNTAEGTVKSKVTSTDRIKYLRYLQKSFDTWADRFIRDVKHNILHF